MKFFRVKISTQSVDAMAKPLAEKKNATVFCFTIGVAGDCLLNLLSSYPILGQGMETGRTCRLTLCSLGIPVMSTLVWNFIPFLGYKPVVILSGYLCLQAVLTVIAACEESET